MSISQRMKSFRLEFRKPDGTLRDYYSFQVDMTASDRDPKGAYIDDNSTWFFTSKPYARSAYEDCLKRGYTLATKK